METHTAGSASGLRKRSDGNIGTAPQADRTARARSPTPVLPTAATTSTATHVRDVDIWRVEVRDDVRDVVPDVDVWDVDVRLVGVDVWYIDVREVDVGDVGEVDVGRTRLGSGSGPVCYPAGRPSPNPKFPLVW